MSLTFHTELRAPVTVRQLADETRLVLSELTGRPFDSFEVLAGAEDWIPHQRSIAPLASDDLDHVIDPDGPPVEDEVNVAFSLGDGQNGSLVSISGPFWPLVLVTPFRSHLSRVLGIAIVVAAARKFGDGVGDMHTLFPHMPDGPPPNTLSPEFVLASLAERPGRYPSLDTAADAIFEKIEIRPTSNRPST